MKVERISDGSVTFTFSRYELRQGTFEETEGEVDKLAWKNLAAHFISYAQRHDPEGQFAVIEDFSGQDGRTIGYTALRSPSIDVEVADLPPMRFPKVSPELSSAELESIRPQLAVVEPLLAETPLAEVG